MSLAPRLVKRDGGMQRPDFPLPPPPPSTSPHPLTCSTMNFRMLEPNALKVDWAEEQTSRTDEFQRELQAKSQEISDLNAEKVIRVTKTLSSYFVRPPTHATVNFFFLRLLK